MIREVEANLKATGIKVLDIEILRIKPDTRAVNWKAFFETGARLGATQVLCAGNDPDINRLTDNYAELCELAIRTASTSASSRCPDATSRPSSSTVRSSARSTVRTQAASSTRSISTAPRTTTRTSTTCPPARSSTARCATSRPKCPTRWTASSISPQLPPVFGHRRCLPRAASQAPADLHRGLQREPCPDDVSA